MSPTQTSNKVHALIQEKFLELQSKYSGYSLRRFALKVQLPSAVVSEVLRGKRKLTYRLAEHFLNHLNVDQKTAQTLLTEVPQKRSRRKKSELLKGVESGDYLLLRNDEMSMIADWWNFAILRCLEISAYSSKSYKKLSTSLNISEKSVKESLDKMIRLGLVELSGGNYRPMGRTLTTTFDVPSVAIRKNQSQGLELAQEAIHQVAVELRDFSAITVTFDPTRLGEFKSKIESFRRELMNEMLSTPKKQVYRMQIQLYPLSNIKDKNNKEKYV